MLACLKPDKGPLPLARALLLDYVTSINTLVEHPEFYNALIHNGDRLMYERGNVETRLPFEELRVRSFVNPKAKAADQDSVFSQRIREGLPDPRAAAQ
jgi:hypothetical protein